MLEPLSNHVVVRKLEQANVTKSGILVAANHEDYFTGVVEAVGRGSYNRDGSYLIPMELQQGEMVLFSPYAGTQVTRDGEKYVVLREDEILAKVDD